MAYQPALAGSTSTLLRSQDGNALHAKACRSSASYGPTCYTGFKPKAQVGTGSQDATDNHQPNGRSPEGDSGQTGDHVVILDLGPEYSAKLEFLWFGVIAHTTLNVPYSKGLLKKYRCDLDMISRSVAQPLYAFHTHGLGPTQRKFVQRVGFNFHHRRMTDDGEWAEMFLYRPPLD